MTEPDDDLSAALRRAGALGPFSQVDEEPGVGWSPLTDLSRQSNELAARVESTRMTLASNARIPAGDVDARVAASVMQLGLAARLVAPALATAVVSGWVPDLDPARMWWDLRGRDPVPLAIVDPEGALGATPTELAALIDQLVIDRLILPLVGAVRDVQPMSAAVLWGNVWSGLAGGLSPMAMSRPDLAGRAGAIVRAVLDLEASRHRDTPRHPGGFTDLGRYRRSTCCLLYRLPGGGLCGDCVLA